MYLGIRTVTVMCLLTLTVFVFSLGKLLYTNGRYAVIELDFDPEQVFKDQNRTEANFNIEVTNTLNPESPDETNEEESSPLQNLTPNEFQILSDTILKDAQVPDPMPSVMQLQKSDSSVQSSSKQHSAYFRKFFDSDRKLTRERRQSTCHSQCNAQKNACQYECERDDLDLDQCRPKQSDYPINTEDPIVKVWFCNSDEATVLSQVKYTFCSGDCNQLTRPPRFTRYSRFIFQYQLRHAMTCTPTGFKTIEVLCSLNGDVYKNQVDDFMISGCACGVVPS